MCDVVVFLDVSSSEEQKTTAAMLLFYAFFSTVSRAPLV